MGYRSDLSNPQLVMLFDDFLGVPTNSEVTDRVIANGNPWGHPTVVEVGGIDASRPPS